MYSKDEYVSHLTERYTIIWNLDHYWNQVDISFTQTDTEVL